MKRRNNFRLECRNAVTVITHQLCERIPLKYDLNRYCGIFDPTNLYADNLKTVVKYFKGLLGELLKCRIMSTDECDAAAEEFSLFLESFPKLSKVLELFDKKKDRLDDFWFRQLSISDYSHLAKISKLVFCLFHGQASVEREFNNNHIVEKVNISPETIIAKKRIINYFRVHDIQPKDMKVNQEMIKAVRYSHKEYIADLERKSAEKVKTDVENRRLAITEDLKDIRKKSDILEKAIEEMEKEADDCFKEAEKKNNMALVIKGNGLKRKSEESRTQLAKLDDVQKDLEEKRRKLN